MFEFIGHVAIASLVIWALFGLSGSVRGRDDTDPPGGRSGLALYTDYGTGVQYVGSPRGGLTPRLDADGHPIIVKR